MPTFYDVDLRKAQLREFAFGTTWLFMPLVAALKVCGFPFPGSTDDPPVESLTPFEVEETALPEAIRAQCQAVDRRPCRARFPQPYLPRHRLLAPRDPHLLGDISA